MPEPRPRVRVPDTAEKGEIIEIKTLISHPMESGQRKDDQGNTIPRHIINEFVAKYNGETVFSADWYPAISANPYMSFFITATDSGKLEFIWTDDNGETYTETAEIEVS